MLRFTFQEAQMPKSWEELMPHKGTHTLIQTERYRKLLKCFTQKPAPVFLSSSTGVMHWGVKWVWSTSNGHCGLAAAGWGGQRKSLGSPGVNGRHQQRPAGSGRGPGSRGLLAEEERVYTSQRNEERRLTWPRMSNASLRSKTSNVV